ncbi:hypothetical protein EST38_g14665 [Candolleomyces aberdarensis]|uniref:Uncharacterized protein n=1 Tax=Candolleomyces aberdarensis TaxID=2316362 RepID=A0A4Q2CWP5_9AGAR|nr:hypothetical protein EST38_g14665 [Candolleomyces aberdarensis]
MARVLIASAPEFDLGELIRTALALDCEELDESESLLAEDAQAPAQGASAMPLTAQGAGAVLPPAAHAGEEKLQSRKNLRRSSKRKREKAEQGRKVRPEAALKYIPKAPILESVAEIVHLPVTSCGYQGLNEGKGHLEETYTVEELLKLGFTEIEWDGVTPQVIVAGQAEKFMIVMSGRPLDPTYQECQARAAQKILQAGEAAGFLPEELDHPRASNSAALNHGIFHGQGTPHPLNLSNGCRTQLLEELCSDPDVCRMAEFADASFKTWSPEVYEEIQRKLEKLYARDPSLSKPFPFSVYPCTAFNFGPQVCCKGHRDSSNYAISWCAIQALGQFNPRRGGHLVIKELKVFIQFPAGSTILIPSALLTHGNTPVEDGEVRLSFTQFCPGGLIRWVDNNFQTQARMQQRLSKKAFLDKMKLKEMRWERGLEKIYMLDRLKNKYMPPEEVLVTAPCAC